jgi:hypothetical protein
MARSRGDQPPAVALLRTLRACARHSSKRMHRPDETCGIAQFRATILHERQLQSTSRTSEYLLLQCIVSML